MKKTLQDLVRVKGSGNSKEQAMNQALGYIQKSVMDKYSGSMIIRIEPMNITVVEAKELSYTERFLLFFFPRQRTKYNVVLDVEVNLFLLDTQEIVFEKIKEKQSVGNMLLGSQFNK